MELEPFALPLSRPLSTADGQIETRRGFLVRAEIDGTVGVGEATPLPGWTEPLDACGDALRAVEEPREALRSGRLDSRPAARHAVSLAVLDAEARAAGVPLYRHLGRDDRVESVPVNATVGDGSPAETAAAVEGAIGAGFPAVKLKVGVRSPEADLERLEAVDAAAAELRVDANGAWSPGTAERLLPALAERGVDLVEQPTAASDLQAHAALRGRGVDVAADESVRAVGVEAILEADAADVVVCKPMALGGVDRALAAASAARDAGADVIVTTTIDGAIARAAAVHLAAALPGIGPCGLATGALLESDLRGGVAPVEGGAAAVPQGKGNIPPG